VLRLLLDEEVLDRGIKISSFLRRSCVEWALVNLEVRVDF
jgi:hypothetical protein